MWFFPVCNAQGKKTSDITLEMLQDKALAQTPQSKPANYSLLFPHSALDSSAHPAQNKHGATAIWALVSSNTILIPQQHEGV